VGFALVVLASAAAYVARGIRGLLDRPDADGEYARLIFADHDVRVTRWRVVVLLVLYLARTRESEKDHDHAR
jgi:hypothetical protein